jgi:hypothetical protein
MLDKVRNPKLYRLLAGVILMFIAGCLGYLSSAEDRLLNLNIDEDYYRSLAVCDQIRIYAQIGSNYVDRDHFVVIMPIWVDDAIGSHNEATVAKCIAEEGDRQIGLLNRIIDKRREVSFSIHALIYKAYNLKLFGYTEIEGFIHGALCTNSIEYPFSPLLLYYNHKFGELPDYIYDDDAIDRLRGDLCHN